MKADRIFAAVMIASILGVVILVCTLLVTESNMRNTCLKAGNSVEECDTLD